MIILALKDEPCTCCGKPSVRRFKGKPYCNKHRLQMMRKGETYETRYDENKIIIKDNYAIMIVKYKNKEYEALIDLEDIDKVIKYKWCCGKDLYVGTGGSSSPKGERGQLHRYVLGLWKSDETLEVDHINGNPLDNRKSNLRLVNHKDNCANRPVQHNNIIGYKNIHYDSTRTKGQYMVGIRYNGKEFHKRCDTLEQALIIRDKKYEEWGIPCEREKDNHELHEN